MLRGFLYPCALGDVAPDATPCAQTVCTFGAWASTHRKEGSRREEGHLIKIKHHPAADVRLCCAVLLTKVMLVHISPSRSAASLLCHTHSRDGFRLEGT